MSINSENTAKDSKALPLPEKSNKTSCASSEICPKLKEKIGARLNYVFTDVEMFLDRDWDPDDDSMIALQDQVKAIADLIDFKLEYTREV